MYIAPKGVIKLLRNVPLDPTYDHTIIFQHDYEQKAYFESFCPAGYSLSEQSYTRVQRGKIRVAIRAENLYRFNYLMFQNNIFDSQSEIGTGKWFYAFIKAVEYVNNEVTEITFDIDVMQTWLFSYELQECFVEREHTASDNWYEHTLDEEIETGETYFIHSETDTTACQTNGSQLTYNTNDLCVYALINRKNHHKNPVTGEWEEGTAPGGTIGKVYNGLKLVGNIPYNSPTMVDDFLDSYYESEIVCVYEASGMFFVSELSGNVSLRSFYKNISNPASANIKQLLGFTPHNRKLFCSPFTKIIVSNNLGSVAEYKWEDWVSGHRGEFALKGSFATSPSMMLYPKYYRNITDDTQDGITYANYPNCAWSGDAYKAWWAQNKSSFTTSVLSNIVGSAGNVGSAALMATVATGNPVIGAGAGVTMAMGNAWSSVRQATAKIKDMKNASNQSHGNSQNDCLNGVLNRIQFNIFVVSIKPEYLRIVDEYFDRFGYACKRNKIPNRNVRPHWCYTKTIGCTIEGSLPADDASKICQIYNNGITFWKPTINGETITCLVGDYTQDNTIAATNNPS